MTYDLRCTLRLIEPLPPSVVTDADWRRVKAREIPGAQYNAMNDELLLDAASKMATDARQYARKIARKHKLSLVGSSREPDVAYSIAPDGDAVEFSFRLKAEQDPTS